MWNSNWQKTYLVGSLIGGVTLSIALASVPRGGAVLDNQPISDIRERRVGRLNFDHEIARLAQAESRYSEDLPAVRAKRVARRSTTPVRVKAPRVRR